jgi:hypothetical protein
MPTPRTVLALVVAGACVLPTSERAGAQLPSTCRLEDHAFAEDVRDHQPSPRLTDIFTKRTVPKLWFWFQVRCPEALDDEPEFEVLWFRDTGGPLGSPARVSPPLRLAGAHTAGDPYRLYDYREASQLNPGSKWIVVIRFKADGVCNEKLKLCRFAIQVGS